MKTIMTKWAMLIALMTTVSCTETETGIEPEPGNGEDGQVALGINPNLKVEAGTKSATKAVVSGAAITYSDYNAALGLGVVVTNKTGNGWYSPDAGNGGHTGHHIWYMGDAEGKNWKSIGEKSSNFAATTEKPYYLTKEVGQVYAYYPYDASNFTGNEESITTDNLKIPVAVVTKGTINATTNNAAKQWNSTTWGNNADKNKKLAVETEKDYLYFANENDYGRYVNNGHATDGPTYDPNSDPLPNTSATNPGYKIKLDMKHAMSMVSFRVYDGGDMSTSTVTFEKFVIKNAIGGGSPFKTGNESMSLTDGAITKVSSAGSLERSITGYTLMKQIESGDENASKFISTGTGTTKVNGQTVSKSVSALVYPIVDGFSDGDIEVAISLKEGNNPAVDYTVALPGISWEAGENYIYTFMAGRNKLTVMDVTVTDWHDNSQQEIPL